MSEDREQRFTFDEVAELYDRHRPGYPERLFDDLFALSDIGPGGRILEIGCGPGKASVFLAARGFPMTCVEPGASMARVARQRLSGFAAVEVVRSTFEDWEAEPGVYGLVVSAQAFHWLSPEVRFARTAAVLRREGSLAIVGNGVVAGESPLHDEIHAAYLEHAPSIAGPRVSHWYGDDGPIPSLVEESGYFGPVIHRRYPWSHVYPVADYLGLLQTHSDHRLLEPEQRARLHAAVGRAIEHHGGTLEVDYVAHLYLARKQGEETRR